MLELDLVVLRKVLRCLHLHEPAMHDEFKLYLLNRGYRL